VVLFCWIWSPGLRLAAIVVMVPSEVLVLGPIRIQDCREVALQEFLGVHQQGTRGSQSCLAPASHGRRAALLSRMLLAALQPPGVMRRPSSCSDLAFSGVIVPSGTSPAATILAKKSSRAFYCGGQGLEGLDCFYSLCFLVLFVNL